MAFSLVSQDRASVAGEARDRTTALAGRVPSLDGLRGLMMLFVLYSHYTVEVPNGLGVLSVGWVGVIVFFVLSGYLVGRLIIEKNEAGNFLKVFYLRRICRTFPSYFGSVIAMLIIGACLSHKNWTHGEPELPFWSYLVFMQNILMTTRNSIGIHWLAPTWTLALEEQFYLVAPFIFIAVPRRWWIAVLVGLGAASLAFRLGFCLAGSAGLGGRLLMPARMDVLSIGLILAVLIKRDAIDWARWSLAVRVTPIPLLFAVAGLERLEGGIEGVWFQAFGPFLIALAGALFILMMVKGAPEARRFEGPVLRFMGDISYSTYLLHLPVLGLMHGFILDAEPDFSTPAQIVVTVAAAAVTIALSTLSTRFLEEPITAWGRTFRWT